MINWRSQSDKDKYDNLLIPVIKERPTTLFVGAGLSVHAGYPLLKELIQLLHTKSIERNINLELSGDWKNNAQICKNELGEEYYQILIDRFNPENNRVRFTSIHTNLVQVRCNSIITTNYDSCIELAFIDLGIIKTPLYYPYLRKSELSSRSIQHIHGFIDPANPHGSVRSVILTTDDFLQAYNNQPNSVKSFLVDLFSEQNVIFLGFNIDTQDKILIDILRSVKVIRRENQRIPESRQLPPITETIHFAILENRADIESDFLESLGGDIPRDVAEKELIQNQDEILKSLGVYSLRYDSDQYHKSVENIIVDLRTLTHTLQSSGSEAGDIV